MVNGKRVKTVDVHAHCLFHEAEKLMGDDNAAFQSPMKEAGRQAFITATLDERLKAMDAQGVDMEVLSINPFWYRKDRDLAAEIVRVQNEKLAELCASKPDRFAAFASLALQFPDLAVAAARNRDEKTGAARRRDRRQRRRRRNSPIPNSIRSGPRPKNSAPCCSSIRRPSRNSPNG